MDGIAEYIFSGQTLTSLIIAIGGFYAGYKVLEKRVEQNEKDIKEIKKEITSVKDNLSTQMEDIKTRVTSVDIQVKELAVNLAWLMDLFKKQ